MAVSSYSRCTLYGNWFEDRSKPLKGVLTDYGHRQYSSTYSAQTAGYSEAVASKSSKAQRLRALQSTRQSMSMVQAHTITEALRPRPVQEAGFNNPLTGDTVGARGAAPRERLLTTTMAAFAPPDAGAAAAYTQAPPQTAPAAVGAGGRTHTRSYRPMGERYNEGADPHCNTAAQRSWLYSLDPVVKYQQEGVPAVEELPVWPPSAGNAASERECLRRIRSITAANDPMTTRGVTVWND